MKIRDKDNIFNHHLLCFIRLKFSRYLNTKDEKDDEDDEKQYVCVHVIAITTMKR